LTIRCFRSKDDSITGQEYSSCSSDSPLAFASRGVKTFDFYCDVDEGERGAA
jgi:hypothetical protein